MNLEIHTFNDRIKKLDALLKRKQSSLVEYSKKPNAKQGYINAEQSFINDIRESMIVCAECLQSLYNELEDLPRLKSDLKYVKGQYAKLQRLAGGRGIDTTLVNYMTEKDLHL